MRHLIHLAHRLGIEVLVCIQPSRRDAVWGTSGAEQARSLAVGDVLRRFGIAIWLDRHAIAGGSAWSTAIVRGPEGLRRSRGAWSDRAFRSPNVQRELNLAVEENRPVLPRLLEQVAPPGVRVLNSNQACCTCRVQANVRSVGIVES